MTQPKPWGRTFDLVRTYKAVNDPSSPSWSIRFVGGLAAFAVLLAGAGALWWASQDGRESAGPAAATGSGAGATVEYVGFAPGTVADPAQVEAAFLAWRQAHPDAVVIAKEPVLHEGRLVGYDVTYRG